MGVRNPPAAAWVALEEWVWSLAWELPHAMDATIKINKKIKKKKRYNSSLKNKLIWEDTFSLWKVYLPQSPKHQPKLNFVWFMIMAAIWYFFCQFFVCSLAFYCEKKKDFPFLSIYLPIIYLIRISVNTWIFKKFIVIKCRILKSSILCWLFLPYHTSNLM